MRTWTKVEWWALVNMRTNSGLLYIYQHMHFFTFNTVLV